MFDKHPHLQGGFIWDWVDQGLINTAQAPSGGPCNPPCQLGHKPSCGCMALHAVFMIPPAHSQCQFTKWKFMQLTGIAWRLSARVVKPIQADSTNQQKQQLAMGNSWEWATTVNPQMDLHSHGQCLMNPFHVLPSCIHIGWLCSFIRHCWCERRARLFVPSNCPT